MKFAIVSDVHIGGYESYKGIYRKATPHAENLLKCFVQKMNKSFKPDFVVQGGDMIEDTNLTVDKKNYKKGLGHAVKIKMSRLPPHWQSRVEISIAICIEN